MVLPSVNMDAAFGVGGGMLFIVIPGISLLVWVFAQCKSEGFCVLPRFSPEMGAEQRIPITKGALRKRGIGDPNTQGRCTRCASRLSRC